MKSIYNHMKYGFLQNIYLQFQFLIQDIPSFHQKDQQINSL